MTNVEVVASFQQALGSGDVAKAFSFFVPEAKWHQPGNNKFSGTKGNLTEIGGMLNAMMSYTAGSLVIPPVAALMGNGSLVASPVRFRATSGGKKMDMAGLDLFEVQDKKITQVWLFSEDQSAEDEFWGN